MVLYLFLTIALLVPIWIGEYFPSQNGPEYSLFVHMAKEYDNPEFNYSDYYEFIVLAIPNLLFHIVDYLLSHILPLTTSTKVVLSLCVILLPASVFYFLNIVDPEKLWLGFAIFPYAYNHFIPKGYSSFYLSISLFFFFLGYLIKHIERLNYKKLIWLSFLIFLTYLSHMFSFLFAIAIVIIYFLSKSLSFGLLCKVLTVFIPSSILFVHYLFFLVAQSRNLVGSGGKRYVYSRYFSVTIDHFMTMYMYSYSRLAALLFIIPLSLISYMVFKRLLRTYKRSKCDSWRTMIGTLVRQDTFVFFILFLSAVYFVLPRDILGWGKFNTRFLPFIFIFMVISAEPFSKTVANRVFLGGISLLSIVMVSIISYHVITINKDLKDYLSGIPLVRKNSTILPVRLEDYKVGKIRPLHWAYDYYNVFCGGATGKSVVNYTGRVPMKYRKPVDELFPPFKPNQPDQADMNRICERYDYVLFWGDNEEILNLFESYGFWLIHQKNKLRLYGNIKNLSPNDHNANVKRP